MWDVLIVVGVTTFFALAVMFVAACERIVGTGPVERGR